MYVLIEGGDGSGKTTLVEELLVRAAYPFTFQIVREPDRHTALGAAALEEAVSGSPLAAALAMAAARAQWMTKSNADLVIADRGFLTTLAYQGADLIESSGRGGSNRDHVFRWIMRMHSESLGFRVPDLVFMLDCDPEVAWKRAVVRGEWLTESRCRKAYDGYLDATAWCAQEGIWGARTQLHVIETTNNSIERVLDTTVRCMRDHVKWPRGAS